MDGADSKRGHLRLVEVQAEPELYERSDETADASAAASAAVDYGVAAHQAAVAHLAACFESLAAEEEGLEGGESPASAPFCGCEDCLVRETLHAAWPFLVAAVKAGVE